MSEPRNYILLKELLDTYGQTEFLRTYGTLDDIYKIQYHFISALCSMYDNNDIMNVLTVPTVPISIPAKLKQD